MSDYDKALERARTEFPHVRAQVDEERTARQASVRDSWTPRRPIDLPTVKDVLVEIGLL